MAEKAAEEIRAARKAEIAKAWSKATARGAAAPTRRRASRAKDESEE